ncbi:MAG: hypothetical protein GX295_02520, partial [Syntrophomonadaceae bacterium]|nr:hypothetical protein [Syntrophomonadaceae bacterium]
MSREISSDIAPFEGRDAVNILTKKNMLGKGCHWRANSFSIMGSIPGPKLKNAKQMIALTGQLEGVSDPDLPGWIELETASESDGASTMLDLLLIGTRPLPVADITCVCRHPLSANYLVDGTRAGKLLLLDAHLSNNLKIVEARPVSAIFQSLVACGPGLLGLVTLSSGVQIHRLQLDSDLPYNSFSYHLSLPLIALAENDFTSFWGLTRTGEVYLLELPKEKESRALDR